jgi:hypothetical protein
VSGSFRIFSRKKQWAILRIAVIGAISPHKGSRQMLNFAENAARRQLSIKFVLFGFTDNNALDLPNVTCSNVHAGTEGSD